MSGARANGVTLEYDVVGEGDPGKIRPWMEEAPGEPVATFLREAR